MIVHKDIWQVEEVFDPRSGLRTGWRVGWTDGTATVIAVGSAMYYELAAIIACEDLVQMAHAIGDDKRPGIVNLHVFSYQRQDIPIIEKYFRKDGNPPERNDFDQYRFPGILVECQVTAVEDAGRAYIERQEAQKQPNGAREKDAEK